MRDQMCQCPFLDRGDSRCNRYFSLDDLRYAFDHCLSDYHGCPLYARMAAEWQRTVDQAILLLEDEPDAIPPTLPLVQVTVSRRVTQPLAGAA